jgi:choice-of-anchor B domain-containing protein
MRDSLSLATPRFAQRCIVLVVAALGTFSQRAWACYNIPCGPAVCALLGANHQHGTGIGGGALTSPGGFDSLNIDLLSNVPLSAMGGGSGSSLYGWVDPLTQREYAIMGRSNGTAFIDITNPTAPVYTANLPKLAGAADTIWREPKVYQNTAYIGVDGTTHRMQVVDLTQLRNYAGTTMTLNAGTYNPGSGTLTVTRIHTLAINADTGFLYAAGTRFETSPGDINAVGLHVINVQNPSNPTFAGTYSGDDYTHETQVVTYKGPDAQHVGKEIAFNSNGKQLGRPDTFSIVDVTNKSAITGLSSKTYANAGYIHQGWLTEDHRFFFQNDEFDEQNGTTNGKTRTHLWDVSDLDNAIYKGFFDHATTSTDHNLYTKDGFLYETNYTTGLRILKIGDLTSNTPSDWLQEVAYFDTFPGNDAAGFNGAWNNYPYFPSGNIVVSDRQNGLFVLRANIPEPGTLAAAICILAGVLRRANLR